MSVKQKCKPKLFQVSSLNSSCTYHETPACVHVHVHKVASVKTTHVGLE